MNCPAPEGFEDRFARIRANREAAGTNVHFVNERGERDMMSMATTERADALRAKLGRKGCEIVL